MTQPGMVIEFTILLAAALLGGMVAHRFRQPVVLGYLVIGIIIGPYGLHFIEDETMVESAATIGVTLLMFSLGLEVSMSQLRNAGKVGLLGGVAQIVVTFSLGALFAFTVLGWALYPSLIFGLAISLSSTMVGFKVLMERGELDSTHGRIMVAILILQDICVVLMALIPTLIAGQMGQDIAIMLGTTLLSAVIFIGITIIAGIWVLPWLFGRVGGIRARELFLLSIIVLCLGAAAGTQMLGISAIFGAFLVGLILRQTTFAYQAMAEITPLRDIFAALFFVSLGMFLDPRFLLDNWALVIMAVIGIICIKFFSVFSIIRLFGYSTGIAILAGVGLSQIGEFSFILSLSGSELGILTPFQNSLIISAAIVTMLLTPPGMSLVSLVQNLFAPLPALASGAAKTDLINKDMTGEPGHVVIAGYGRVGQNIARGLKDAGIPYAVVEIDPEVVSKLKSECVSCLFGDASNTHILSQAGLKDAGLLVVTFPDPLAVLTTVKVARDINPKLRIVGRVHRAREAELLARMGVTDLVNPEYEASLAILRKIFSLSGFKQEKIAEAISQIGLDPEIMEFSREGEE